MEDTSAPNNADAIKKQIEFYFSDSNFRKDAFLRGVAESDADGYVPISTLLTFNKLKALTTNVHDVVRSLVGSEVVAVSDDHLKLKRVSDLPTTDTSRECTLYVKGFPENDPDVTIEVVEEQFSAYGKVCMVKLRKDLRTKKFKGSAFIEYADKAAVEKAVKAAHDAENNVVESFKGNPFLCVMSLNDWLSKKEAKKVKAVETKAAPAAGANKRKRDEETEAAEGKVNFTEGLIVSISNIPAGTQLMPLKDALRTYGDLKYVEFEREATSGFVRMGSKEAADNLVEAINNKTFKIGDNVIEGSKVSGQEETQYWEKIGTGGHSNKKGRGGGRGGGRGRGRGRGGRGGRR